MRATQWFEFAGPEVTTGWKMTEQLADTHVTLIPLAIPVRAAHRLLTPVEPSRP
ncbi:MAG: hypothetical protein QM677_08505 [Microbacterium sp.]